ncbi:hypothetical protein FKW77_009630 [Venturia effusa]|uniref:Uncharacterized protein n=1 Tax=Venturia effusa TaxID=50376 RepID=A0A517L9Z8_9PEZI|nr:hypothetical protein FKW77_009630 [Venturia effusa]
MLWLQDLEELTLELSSDRQTSTLAQDSLIKQPSRPQRIEDTQHALNNSWVRSPLGFVKAKEKPECTQKCLGREWIRGPLGFTLYIRDQQKGEST